LSDLPKDAKRGRLGFLLGLLLIVGGAYLAIALPAQFAPSSYTLLGEDGVVEFLQLIFLVLSAALFFAAAPHAGRIKPIFQALGFGAVAGAIGEYAVPLEDLLSPMKTEWLLWPIFVVIAYLFFSDTKAFSRFWGYASRRPAAGFMFAGLIIAYVFVELFGSSWFWQKHLGTGFDPRIPKVVDAYLELLACYFIFVASIGFALPVTGRANVQKAREKA